MQSADVVIIGGGIVGLATGWELVQRFPQLSVVLLEKEAEVAMHQTGRNSGVLHSGIYYKPGSLKAANCRLGKEALEAFCRREKSPFDVCGKVIVALADRELPALERILRAWTGQWRSLRADRCQSSARAGAACGGHPRHPRARGRHRRLSGGLRPAGRTDPRREGPDRTQLPRAGH